ncbi:MAG: electron transfer flavoprotein subunit beta [Deltaproteobacteria bacterium]|nr:electron transfer flavoprotein subunit beta [Deltaproteobacteria bacterium]
MNIVVCIKQVPDEPIIRIDWERMTLIREGVTSTINPLDRIALEAGLAMRGRAGGRVTVLSMGPPQSEEALREALAAGADRAILLTDQAFAGSDTLATSHVLARAISRLGSFPDLILCGVQTIDSDTGHVGPQIAEELNLPQVCSVQEISLEGDSLVVERLSDGFLETVRVSLPALVSVNRELCPVRSLPLGDLEIAFSKKDITRWGREELGLSEEEVGFKGSATRVRRLLPPAQTRKGRVVSGSPHLLVDHAIRTLEALGILEEEDGYS